MSQRFIGLVKLCYQKRKYTTGINTSDLSAKKDFFCFESNNAKIKIYDLIVTKLKTVPIDL